jgi:hypothetical protein
VSSARSDYISIGKWVNKCEGLEEQTGEVTYGAPLQRGEVIYIYRDRPVVPQGPTLSFDKDPPPPPPPPTGYPRAARSALPTETSLMLMNRKLWDQRVYISQKASDAYDSLQLFTWISIAIGLVTTIMVSISTTDIGRGDARAAKVIRILAIVFPALGTASAAVVGFYSPRDAMTRSLHTLASLSQLHGEMAMDIWKLECVQTANQPIDKAARQKAAIQLSGWSKRYLDLMAVSETAESSPSGQAGSNQVGSPQRGSDQIGPAQGGPIQDAGRR